MKFIIRGFVTNKESEFYSDCADSYAFSEATHRFAISDGVSISFFSDIWSRILVDNYVKSNELVGSVFVEKCQQQWQEKIETIVQKPDVKWFVKSKYSKKDFAAATFVGLEFLQTENKWRAQFIGDSFLFFIPKHCIYFEGVIKYPSQTNFIFDNYPNYLASIENNHRGEWHISENEEITEGTFVLMTDALSEWFIKELKKDVKKAVATLAAIENQEQFAQIIQTQREENTLKNDDSTFLMVEVVDNQTEEFTHEVVHFTDLRKMTTNTAREKQKNQYETINFTENQSNIFDKF
ncbi:hypothetical protein [Capnocytophaga sp.]|uniref:hypothetical protein n=1 Tax=Capnocytophaga sp. TaxID=44737 RepID=UPI0026DAF038|nr:hypothetical protein [Capnocytophaga sp.]MDO5105879.1 hypothetical protein [Capnocytophaga sp.]